MVLSMTDRARSEPCTPSAGHVVAGHVVAGQDIAGQDIAGQDIAGQDGDVSTAWGAVGVRSRERQAIAATSTHSRLTTLL